MCKKKISIDQPEFTSRTISALAISDYPGTANDLAGPVPDAKDFKKAVLSLWPDITHREFLNYNATARRLLSEIQEACNHVGEDGMLFFIMDTCHAESSTRNGGRQRRRAVRPALRNIGYDRVLVFSAAMSYEYASDAQFPMGANGAWHYALIKTLERGITYRQWFDRAVAMLRQLGFKQTPVIEGPTELQNRLVFEGNVNTIEVSSHGGQAPDQDGDEPDKLDELIYMYDRAVRDDQIRAILTGMKRRIYLRGIFSRIFPWFFKNK